MFKYWACPNELSCKGKFINPPMNGTVIQQQVKHFEDAASKTASKESSICSFVIAAPSEMTETDQMMLKIDNISNAVVYIVKGKAYKWINHLDS